MSERFEHHSEYEPEVLKQKIIELLDRGETLEYLVKELGFKNRTSMSTKAHRLGIVLKDYASPTVGSVTYHSIRDRVQGYGSVTEVAKEICVSPHAIYLAKKRYFVWKKRRDSLGYSENSPMSAPFTDYETTRYMYRESSVGRHFCDESLAPYFLGDAELPDKGDIQVIRLWNIQEAAYVLERCASRVSRRAAKAGHMMINGAYSLSGCQILSMAKEVYHRDTSKRRLALLLELAKRHFSTGGSQKEWSAMLKKPIILEAYD